MLRKLFWPLLFLLISNSAFSSECEIWEDELRINHVKTKDEQSFYYCFGYLHGRDRAWLMDHFRRVALGKNSEVHGFSHMQSDMSMRLLDLPRWADKIWSTLTSKDQEFLLAYTEGVNHGFRANQKLPTSEFKNGHPLPDSWQPQHSLLILLLQSFDQTRKGFLSELEEAKAQEIWKEKTLSLFDTDAVPWDTTVLKSGEYKSDSSSKSHIESKSIEGNLWAHFPPIFGEESGSNNWVIAPNRSKSNTAMLANDPHLDLKTPMFWYWIHLQNASTDVIGASLPGVPLIVSGTNRNVSWGLTNSYLNTSDGIQIDKKEEQEFETFRPVVWVKWSFLKIPIFFKSFQRTKEGYPVLPFDVSNQAPIVLRWSGFHLTGKDLQPLQKMMQASSSEEMESILSTVGVPSWNFVFADVKGEIGHRVVGKAFKGTKKDPAGFRVGSMSDIKQPQFLSPTEMPHVINPSRGYIVTANNRHWPADSVNYGGRAYSPGFRAFRIEELIVQNQHDLESFRKIQCDDQAVDARFLAPLLLQAIKESNLSGDQQIWLNQLKAWDFNASLDCKVCPIYRLTLNIAFETLKVSELGFWKLGQERNLEWQNATQKAFNKAFKVLNGKTWRDVHINSFSHMSNRSDWVYSPKIPTRGDRHSVDPGTAKWNAESNIFEHVAGASERLIVVMNKTPQIWLSLPGLNNKYDQTNGLNPWQSWADCKLDRVTWPVNWNGLNTNVVKIDLAKTETTKN